MYALQSFNTSVIIFQLILNNVPQNFNLQAILNLYGNKKFMQLTDMLTSGHADQYRKSWDAPDLGLKEGSTKEREKIVL